MQYREIAVRYCAAVAICCIAGCVENQSVENKAIVLDGTLGDMCKRVVPGVWFRDAPYLIAVEATLFFAKDICRRIDIDVSEEDGIAKIQLVEINGPIPDDSWCPSPRHEALLRHVSGTYDATVAEIITDLSRQANVEASFSENSIVITWRKE